MKRRSLRLHLETLEDRTLLSSPGDVEWLRQFGSLYVPQSLDPAQSVVADGSGNIYVAGEVQGTAALPGQTSFGGSDDAYVRKYDSNGIELWSRQFGTDGDDQATGIAVDDSGVYVAGYAPEALPGQITSGAFVRKYDLNGNELWTRQFSNGGLDHNGVAVDGSGVYLAGETGGTFPGQTSAGNLDGFVRKYDTDGNELWTRQFGTANADGASGIAADATGVYVGGFVGGYVVVGGHPVSGGALPGRTSAGDQDAFVRKYDPNGNELWTRQFGTADVDGISGIAVNATGIYGVGFVGGSHTVGGQNVSGGALPGQTSAGDQDAFVRKYDPNGNELWTRQFGTNNYDIALGVAVDSSGVYVAGGTYGTLPGQTTAGNFDAFVRKYDTDSSEVWTRQFGSTGRDSDHVNGIAVDGSGVYLAGAADGTLPGQVFEGIGSFVRKYDLGGNEIWTQEFSGVLPAPDFARAVDADGNVYVAGELDGFIPGQIFGGAFIRKYDVAGNELWTRQLGFSSEDNFSSFASAFAVVTDGPDVYLAGFILSEISFQKDAFIRKYDGDGNELWTRQFGTDSQFGTDNVDQATALAVDGDAVYVAGFTDAALPGLTNAGGDDAFVRKYDKAGNELWTRQFGTSGSDQVTGSAADASGVYLSGFTTGTLPGQTSAGGQDAFVRRYDPDGNVLWTSQFGTATTDSATGIAVDASGIYVSGFTGGTLAEIHGDTVGMIRGR